MSSIEPPLPPPAVPLSPKGAAAASCLMGVVVGRGEAGPDRGGGEDSSAPRLAGRFKAACTLFNIFQMGSHSVLSISGTGQEWQ
jgi:hypothetical protein